MKRFLEILPDIMLCMYGIWMLCVLFFVIFGGENL